MFEDAVELGGAEAIAVGVEHPQGGAAVQNEVRETVARKDAIEEVFFSGEIGGRVAVVGGLQIEQIRRDGGQMAALVVVPDVEVAEGEEIGHDVLERLRQLGIVARAPMPDGGAGAAGDEDFGVVVERAADILEGGISGEVELLQVGIFEADAFQIGQVGENDVPEGGGLKAFDGFEVGASREIEGVGEGVVRGGEIAESGRRRRKIDGGDVLRVAEGQGRGFAAVGGVEAEVDGGQGFRGLHGEGLEAFGGGTEILGGIQIGSGGAVAPGP